jgi:hypothetical protein
MLLSLVNRELFLLREALPLLGAASLREVGMSQRLPLILLASKLFTTKIDKSKAHS